VRNGVEKKVKLSDVTERDYQEKYRGHLFCPNSNCGAKIIFASGAFLKYFRTFPVKTEEGKIISQHVADCDYSVEHEMEERVRRRRDPELRIAISSEHILRTLKRAHEKLVNPQKTEKGKDKEVSGTKQKRPSEKSKVSSDLPASGVPGTISNGASELTGREPSIYHRSVNDLSEHDYYYMRAVDGYIQDMILGDEYTYINLRRNDNKKARVLFSEAFAVNSPGINNTIYKKYIDLCKEQGEVPLVCIGDITRDDYEISIVIDSFEALMINGKRYYGIVNELHGNKQ
jgi:hypothetical protein